MVKGTILNSFGSVKYVSFSIFLVGDGDTKLLLRAIVEFLPAVSSILEFGIFFEELLFLEKHLLRMRLGVKKKHLAGFFFVSVAISACLLTYFYCLTTYLCDH